MNGSWRQDSDSGPSGSLSHFGTCFSVPGMATGMMEPGATEPALPKEVPSPGAWRSTTVTRCPSRCK